MLTCVSSIPEGAKSYVANALPVLELTLEPTPDSPLTTTFACTWSAGTKKDSLSLAPLLLGSWITTPYFPLWSSSFVPKFVLVHLTSPASSLDFVAPRLLTPDTVAVQKVERLS